MSSNLNIPEEMSSFFNERALGYEDHMKGTVNDFEKYYDIVSDPICATKDRIKVLDLGCGTGLEIKGILKKAPNVEITCIDMSDNMLSILKDRYKDYEDQINVVKASYVTLPFKEKEYDYVIAVMTMHHFLQDEKRSIYEKIKNALKFDGRYIEGDYVVSEESERDCLGAYRELHDRFGLEASNLYHIDIPFSMETQKRLFQEAGFSKFELIFRKGEHSIYYLEA